ncbi:MAG: flagellar biosynthetic protein FliO [Candidatus Lambdaproteobacteria bacterium]|nr:flagellar biosynthetic protein FliO [Candidatus Lambdaproteobacteria bacterium]
MSARSRMACMMLAGLLLLAGGGAWGQVSQRILEEMRGDFVGGREALHLTFSVPFQGQPRFQYDQGSFEAQFFGVGSTKPVREFQMPDSQVLTSCKVEQGRSSTTLRCTLKNPRESLAGRLEVRQEQKLLTLILPAATKPAAAAAVASQDAKRLQSELNQTLFGTAGGTAGGASGSTTGRVPTVKETAPAPAPPAALGAFSDTGMLVPLVTMVLAVALVVAALYGVLFLHRRFVAGRLEKAGGGYTVRQLASYHVGTRQRIVVVEINGAVFACGVTPTQISMLTRLDSPPAGRRSLPTPAGPAHSPLAGPTPPAHSPAEGVPSQAASAPVAQPPPARLDPVSQFAETLKEKVRSLKRLS